KHDERGEDAAQHEVDGDLVERRLDVARLVADDLRLYVRRELPLDARERLLDALDDLDGVGARLALYLERDGWHAVQARERALLLRAVLDAPHVAQAYGR